LVYLNRIENKNIFINQGRNINQYTFFKLAEKIFELNINYLDEEVLKEQTTTYNEIEQIKQVVNHKSIKLL
jgi:predicted transcriptional regulator